MVRSTDAAGNAEAGPYQVYNWTVNLATNYPIISGGTTGSTTRCACRGVIIEMCASMAFEQPCNQQGVGLNGEPGHHYPIILGSTAGSSTRRVCFASQGGGPQPRGVLSMACRTRWHRQTQEAPAQQRPRRCRASVSEPGHWQVDLWPTQRQHA